MRQASAFLEPGLGTLPVVFVSADRIATYLAPAVTLTCPGPTLLSYATATKLSQQETLRFSSAARA